MLTIATINEISYALTQPNSTLYAHRLRRLWLSDSLIADFFKGHAIQVLDGDFYRFIQLKPEEVFTFQQLILKAKFLQTATTDLLLAAFLDNATSQVSYAEQAYACLHSSTKKYNLPSLPDAFCLVDKEGNELSFAQYRNLSFQKEKLMTKYRGVYRFKYDTELVDNRNGMLLANIGNDQANQFLGPCQAKTYRMHIREYSPIADYCLLLQAIPDDVFTRLVAEYNKATKQVISPFDANNNALYDEIIVNTKRKYQNFNPGFFYEKQSRNAESDTIPDAFKLVWAAGTDKGADLQLHEYYGYKKRAKHQLCNNRLVFWLLSRVDRVNALTGNKALASDINTISALTFRNRYLNMLPNEPSLIKVIQCAQEAIAKKKIAITTAETAAYAMRP
jgi:hypothetical protein